MRKDPGWSQQENKQQDWLGHEQFRSEPRKRLMRFYEFEAERVLAKSAF